MRKIIFSITVIIIIIGSLAKFRCTSDINNQSKDMVISGNMLNDGFVIQGENSDIYFRELSNDSALSQLKSLTDDKISVIASNIGLCYLYYDSWVYCSYGYNSNLARVNVNTGEVQILLEKMCNNLILVEGIIYCTLLPDNALYSMLPDGSQLTLISPESSTNLIFDSNNIYFLSNNSLFTLNNGIAQEMLYGLNIKNFLIVSEQVCYVTTDGYLYVVELDGSNNQLVWGHDVWAINTRDSELVFIAVDENAVPRTYQYNPKTGDIEVIYKNGFSSICVANNHIFEFVSSRGLLCIDTNDYIYTFEDKGAVNVGHGGG